MAERKIDAAMIGKGASGLGRAVSLGLAVRGPLLVADIRCERSRETTKRVPPHALVSS